MGRSEKQGGCSICRCLSSLTSLLLVAAGGYAAWFFLGKPSASELGDMAKDFGQTIRDIDLDDFSDVLQNFTGFTPEMWDEDPYVGDNTSNLWEGFTKGNGGLKLQLWNALDDTWTNEYIEAVDDWNNWCEVKVLDLSSKDVEVDRNCSQVDGVMHVCNGNYGETGWLGINQVMKFADSGIIFSSVAKMNEHYLLNADYDERLYTMCHELGHGYGLPHTDENFNNKDQGNCLDYTNTPSNNLRPGTANCNRLLSMYGSVDGTISGNRNRTLRSQRFLRYSSDAERYEDFAGDDDDYLDYDDEYGTDDAEYYFEYARLEHPNMTAEVDEAMRDFHYDLAYGKLSEDYEDDDDDVYAAMDVQEQRRKWRRLQQHERGGNFVRKLNDDFVLEVHVLYPRK